MTDEMKLLTALCEALGFDVERVVNVVEKEVSEVLGDCIINTSKLVDQKTIKGALNVDNLSIDTRGAYTRTPDNGYILVTTGDPEYKLTKRVG